MKADSIRLLRIVADFCRLSEHPETRRRSPAYIGFNPEIPGA